MKVLVLYAHWNPKSFCNAILESFTTGLKDGGHTVEILDLYSMKFDPTIKVEDMAQWTGGQMPQDVLAQQEKVSQADALAYIYPTVGYFLPAILWGWGLRVFSHGFAYSAGPEGVKGLLNIKKAICITTTGFPEDFYKTTGVGDAANKINATVFWTFGTTNFETVFLYSPQTVGDDVRKGYLEKAYSLGKEF
jgi:NAD(P)H dehydrogenase (quinone)